MVVDVNYIWSSNWNLLSVSAAVRETVVWESVKVSCLFDMNTTQMCNRAPSLLAEDVSVCVPVWVCVYVSASVCLCLCDDDCKGVANNTLNVQQFSPLMKACFCPTILDLHKFTRNARIDLNYNILNACLFLCCRFGRMERFRSLRFTWRTWGATGVQREIVEGSRERRSTSKYKVSTNSGGFQREEIYLQVQSIYK